MIKKGAIALVGAASLLLGSTVATAQTSAASLSVSDSVRSGAAMAEASAQDDEGVFGSPVLIGVGIFIVIVVAIYFLAESDDPVSA